MTGSSVRIRLVACGLPAWAVSAQIGGWMPRGVTGNTSDSGSEESWFDPRRGNYSEGWPSGLRRRPAKALTRKGLVGSNPTPSAREQGSRRRGWAFEPGVEVAEASPPHLTFGAAVAAPRLRIPPRGGTTGAVGGRYSTARHRIRFAGPRLRIPEVPERVAFACRASGPGTGKPNHNSLVGQILREPPGQFVCCGRSAALDSAVSLRW